MDSLQEALVGQANVAPELAPEAPVCPAKAAAAIVALEAEFVPHTEAQRVAFDDALRLLAAWAVRAARPTAAVAGKTRATASPAAGGITQGR